MDTKTLAKALRQELTRSPKKTSMLGLGLLVALYFWAPLVWQWLPAGNTPSLVETPAQQRLVLASATPDSNVGGTAAANADPITWKQAMQLRAQDNRLSSAAFDDSWLDPFRVAKAKTDDDEPEDGDLQAAAVPDESVDNQIKDLSPQQLGLVLSSTIVGPRRRSAQINGKTFREQAEVVVRLGSETSDANSMAGENARPQGSYRDGRPSQSVEIVFVLERVEKDHVILAGQGQLFELYLPNKGSSDTSDLVITRSADIGT